MLYADCCTVTYLLRLPRQVPGPAWFVGRERGREIERERVRETERERVREIEIERERKRGKKSEIERE